MKILFIAPFPPPITGHSLASKVFYEALSIKYDVTVINLSAHSTHGGAVSMNRTVEVAKIFARVLRHSRSADAIYLTISESLAGNIKDLLIYLACIGKLSKVYIHLHGGSIKKELFDRYVLLKWLNSFVIKRLAGVIISGSAHEPIFVGMIDSQRIHKVFNFAEDSLFVEDGVIAQKFEHTSPLKLLYLSGMTEDKGYFDLCNAYLELDSITQKQIHLDFAGKFYLSSDEKRFIQQIEGIGTVKYHGVVDDEKKKSLFAQAHVFCLPSKMFEGQPISILEAYASGCVVVTTGQDGIRDIFEDEQNGFQIDAGELPSITTVLSKLIANQASLGRIAQNNRDLAEKEYRPNLFNAALTRIIQYGLC